MTKQERLDRITKEIENCQICKKDKVGMAVAGEGNPDADIIFIGEAPGKKEAETGRPFIGRSGQLLRGLIRTIGLKEEEVYITSPVKYLPVRGTPTPQEIRHGREHLLKQIEVIQPKVIVLLGRVAAEGVLQKKVFVSKEHGKLIAECPFGQEKEPVKFFLTYHPAAALRFPRKFKPFLENDFQKIKKMIQV